MDRKVIGIAAGGNPDGTPDLFVACDDGSVFFLEEKRKTPGSTERTEMWVHLPPVPGTPAEER